METAMSLYEEAHANPAGPGDSRPTALQIVKDQELEGKLKGKVFVITGTSSGIGIETARALSVTGATLYLTARNVSKARSNLVDVLNTNRVEIVEMNQESLQSVRDAAKEILAKTDRVNVLINNAGIMGIQTRQLTQDGNEMHFGVNHLSHFLLFQLLKPALLAAATPEFPSRVVNVSSSVHRIRGLNGSGNYNFSVENYDPTAAYAQSKTANIYMTNEIERRYGPSGIHATSLHPGVVDTSISKNLPKAQVDAILGMEKIQKMLKSPEQGAATTVWAAVGKEWATRGGIYLSDCAETSPEMEGSDLNDTRYHARHVFNPESEGKLWKDSLKLVGFEEDP
ncbi:putative short-chain dehydrogenase [Colletotrichum truncatum]|uniref:Short-chain dehydrogenase n=1 Tax=Colletotrichum truncatum TaxID=5467 RepID=A0ACC3YXQ8_COLTU|nr:putative short-chain dehydrogenase [Colletotrichum truncatum]KAF6790944.1 putative short-chain dehydrogenase [Colletotrichum truncatum]